MPKVSLFEIKIQNKPWKTRKNLLTSKSVVTKRLRTEDRNRGQSRW
jgi:hypothetical protein